LPISNAEIVVLLLSLQVYPSIRQQLKERGVWTMIYAVFLEDDARRAGMRAKHLPDHLAFLERNASSIHAAGPLKDTASDASAGGLWIVQADSPQTVQSLIEADPFWPTGLRKSVRILEWTRVFSDGERQI
jgi:uncharacterized protein YciI